MEGNSYNYFSNSNIEIENDNTNTNNFQYNQYNTSTNFLNSNYTIQISTSPISHRNNYFQSLLEEDPHQASEEKNGEFMIQYDIYGNSINRTLLNSPLPRYSNRSYELGTCTFNGLESPCQEMEIIEPEITEWEVEKENIDPKGVLTTPYKSRTPNRITNSNTGVSTSGRSPLQDITPSVEKRKSVTKNSGIEVKKFSFNS